MIEALKGFPADVLAFVCHGRISKADYDDVLIPAVRVALGKHNKLRLYYETAADFTGIEPGAIWKDFKIGLEHLKRWERMAVVSDVEWIKHTMQFFSFIMPGELRTFPRAEGEQARAWIVAK